MEMRTTIHPVCGEPYSDQETEIVRVVSPSETEEIDPLEDTPQEPSSTSVPAGNGVILLPENDPGVKRVNSFVRSKGRVYVHGYFANAVTKKMFFYMGYDLAKAVSDSDIVVWTGGEDINPKIYGEKPAGAVGWSDLRDHDDYDVFKAAKSRFKVGICRGAQLLNCLPPNDGRLWQDIDMHDNGDHPIRDHITNEELLVNSLHHQQMRVSNRGEVVAGCHIARVKDSFNATWHCDGSYEDEDVEVAWYPGTKSLCFQPHPEFDTEGPTGKYFERLLDRYFHAA